jgi:hypothetical protein
MNGSPQLLWWLAAWLLRAKRGSERRAGLARSADALWAGEVGAVAPTFFDTSSAVPLDVWRRPNLGTRRISTDAPVASSPR